MIFWIIEDHQLIFEALRTQLQLAFEGADFRYERNIEVDEIKRAEKMDCIVFDLDLGYGPRFDILGALTREYPDVPVVVLSGTSDPDAVARAKDLGAAAYIQKGLSTKRILEVFRDVLVSKNRFFATTSTLVEPLINHPKYFPSSLTSRECRY